MSRESLSPPILSWVEFANLLMNSAPSGPCIWLDVPRIGFTEITHIVCYRQPNPWTFPKSPEQSRFGWAVIVGWANGRAKLRPSR